MKEGNLRRWWGGDGRHTESGTQEVCEDMGRTENPAGSVCKALEVKMIRQSRSLPVRVSRPARGENGHADVTVTLRGPVLLPHGVG